MDVLRAGSYSITSRITLQFTDSCGDAAVQAHEAAKNALLTPLLSQTSPVIKVREFSQMRPASALDVCRHRGTPLRIVMRSLFQSKALIHQVRTPQKRVFFAKLLPPKCMSSCVGCTAAHFHLILSVECQLLFHAPHLSTPVEKLGLNERQARRNGTSQNAAKCGSCIYNTLREKLLCLGCNAVPKSYVKVDICGK
jgi:predicted XRE-type DNA-binding protein